MLMIAVIGRHNDIFIMTRVMTTVSRHSDEIIETQLITTVTGRHDDNDDVVMVSYHGDYVFTTG